MSKLKVQCFAISIDGFGAGPNQSTEFPLGEGGEQLHDWFVPTRTFQAMYGKSEGTSGTNDQFAKRGLENIGAWIMGRNMFGPIRGEWTNEEWMGWWGRNPPYHVPVYVLTHHARKAVEMEGGTTFHFVTDGVQSALDQARKAAKGKEIRLGGGTATVRQYLEAGLIDELHFAISPLLLGSGEHLLGGLDLKKLGYSLAEHVTSEDATHVVLQKI